MPVYSHQGVSPLLGRDVFIAPNATVIGDVHLGDEASVWFGTVIRGDVFPIRFGARTNVQDNSVVHVTGGQAATTVGDDVTIGHLVLLHGCTVGNRCLIGMGSVILDGAEIGDDCLVAAGSLVPPRMRVPPRSMVVGRPAKRIREVDEKDLQMIRDGGRLYVEYGKTFLSGAVKLVSP
jgi:carbonic anhydrase/acetyltransferase-like protein (isoleucine patch superfamily)